MLSAKHCTVTFGLLCALLTISAGAAPDHRAAAGEPGPLREEVLGQGGRDLGPARLAAVHDPVDDAPYTVSIGGEVLPLEPAGTIVPAYYESESWGQTGIRD